MAVRSRVSFSEKAGASSTQFKPKLKVLIAVDTSGLSKKAFDYYMEFLHRPENKVYVVHEADQPELPNAAYTHSAFFWDEVKEIVHEHKKVLQDLNRLYTSECNAIPGLNYEVIVDTTEKEVGEGLVKKAKELKVDMVVLGTRGHGAIRRTILGSVTDYVIQHLDVPVLACHK